MAKQRYEYVIDTVPDKIGGAINTDGVNRTISERCKDGWRLLTAFTNELGKNAVAVGGIGINATVDQTVLIFERIVGINEEIPETLTSKIKIAKSNIHEPFIPRAIKLMQRERKASISLMTFNGTGCDLQAVKATIILRNPFYEEYRVENAYFYDFEKPKYESLSVSSSYNIEVPEYMAHKIRNVDIVVHKFIANGESATVTSTQLASQQDVIEELQGETGFDCSAFMNMMGILPSAIEINKAVINFDQFYPGQLSRELLDFTEKQAIIEKSYGNRKEKCLKGIKEILDRNEI